MTCQGHNTTRFCNFAQTKTFQEQWQTGLVTIPWCMYVASRRTRTQAIHKRFNRSDFDDSRFRLSSSDGWSGAGARVPSRSNTKTWGKHDADMVGFVFSVSQNWTSLQDVWNVFSDKKCSKWQLSKIVFLINHGSIRLISLLATGKMPTAYKFRFVFL